MQIIIPTRFRMFFSYFVMLSSLVIAHFAIYESRDLWIVFTIVTIVFLFFRLDWRTPTIIFILIFIISALTPTTYEELSNRLATYVYWLLITSIMTFAISHLLYKGRNQKSTLENPKSNHQ